MPGPPIRRSNTRRLPIRSPTARASIRVYQRSSAFPIVMAVNFKLDRISNQLQRTFPTIVAAVKSVHSGLVLSGWQFRYPYRVPVKRILRPSGRNDVWSRAICSGPAAISSVNIDLHLHTVVWPSIVNDPSVDRFFFDNSFTPTMKSRRKQFCVDDDSKRADKDCLQD